MHPRNLWTLQNTEWVWTGTKSISVINFVKNFKVATDYWSSYHCHGLTKLQRDRLIMAGNRASVIFRQVSWGNPKIWFREVDLLQLSCFPVVRVNCLHLFIRAIFHVHFQTHIKTIQLFVFLPVLQEFPGNLCCRRYQQILTDGMTQKVVEWKVNRIGEEKGACMRDVALFYLQEVNIRFILTIPICYPANICREQTNISFLSRIFFPLPFYTEK